jgi:hypothetical protein
VEEDRHDLPERARGAPDPAADEGLLPGHRAGRAVHRRGHRRPVEIIKYFGEDAVIAKECEIAYNATFMALLWDAVATKNAKLLNQGIQSLPDKLDRATWLNYVRCHDDIGLGFDDADIVRSGYEPHAHRRFLVDYFTGAFDRFARPAASPSAATSRPATRASRARWPRSPGWNTPSRAATRPRSSTAST